MRTAPAAAGLNPAGFAGHSLRRGAAIGEKHNATSGQVTLAWILAQGPEFVVIPGTKKIKYLQENMGASKIKLSPEEIAAVRQIAEESDVPGGRYEASGMAGVLIDSPELPK
ncbi:hypothetical protein B0H17DRAFT_944612 [Mycena rosella]|uniref:NADP-dependent oxidoreductase domain-containing protein n=1 Tax=Mycena rosella TaxID=1033263 RepID=A0AAD7D438_MYCRO|nr:hypothetical protein B0H17DRAFT_944612 [Mycena rosella]